MTDLQIFNYNTTEIRTVSIGGEPWFVAKDVCDVLELANSRDATSKLDSDDVGITDTIDSLGRVQQTTIINEPGLYSLVMVSRKPEAKAFKRWITHEVIPAIRKTGSYTKPMTQAELLAAQAQVLVELERKTTAAYTLAEQTSDRVEAALDVFAAPSDKDWRQDMNARMRGICQEHGLNYMTFYGELYQELELTAHVNLDARLRCLKKRLMENGATKTYCSNLPKLEVIDRDPKLRPIFEGIVRRQQARYARALYGEAQ